MEKKIFKAHERKFFNETGRFIDYQDTEWLVVKDMFGWLGKLDSNNQIDHRDRDKLNQFLEDIGQITARETFPIDFNKKKGRGNKSNGSIQEVLCIKVDVVPMVLTQFRPTARAGQERYQQWCDLMKFINEVLVELEAYKFITEDKEYQKNVMSKLKKLVPSNYYGNPYKKANTHVALVLGLMVDGKEKPIWKNEITSLANGTTIEGLKLRKEIEDVYINTYEMFLDFDIAYEKTKEVMLRRYQITA
jgi:hypothetical protein